MDLTYVFHEADGSVHAELDSHLCGLFPTETWLTGLRDAGFEDVRSVELAGDDGVGAMGFAGVRPGA